MLCETSILEFLLELIAVDVVLVLSTNKDHQVIVTIFLASVYWTLRCCAMMLTNERVVFQDHCGSLFESKLVFAAMSPICEGRSGSDGSEPGCSQKEEKYSNDCVI